MNKIKNSKKIIIGILIFLILIELVFTIIYTNKYFIKFEMDADYATDSLYAKYLAETGKILLTEDWYPSTEVYTVHHQLIMTPLFYIFDDYTTVYTITTAISFIIIALVFYYFMKTFSKSTIKSLLAVLLVCNPINTFFVTLSIVFHGYMFYAILGVLYITILFKLIYKEVNKFEKIVLMIVSLLSGICGVRMFLILFVPLALLLLWNNRKTELKLKKITIQDKKTITIVITYILAFLGFFIYKFILIPKFAGGNSFQSIGTSNENIIHNIQDIILLLLNGLGLSVNDKSVLSLSFIKTIMLSMFWIFVFTQNIILAFKKNIDKAVQNISLYNLICILVTIFFMIITIKNEHLQESLRYFGLSIYLVIPIAIIGLNKPDTTIKTITIYTAIFMAIISGLDIYVDHIKIAKDKKFDREGYIEFLDKSEYTFGTATYWNASITTFWSKKGIEVRPTLDIINLDMYNWNTKKSYKDREIEFLVLRNDEYIARNDYITKRNVEIANSVVYKDDYYVIIDLR